MEIPKYFYFRVRVINKGTGVEVEDASDVDVVEVVRCKDCKWHEHEELSMVWCPFQYTHNVVGSWVDENGFCSKVAKMDEKTLCETCAYLDIDKDGNKVCWVESDVDYIFFVNDHDVTCCDSYEKMNEVAGGDN